MDFLILLAITLAIILCWHKPIYLLILTILALPAYQIRFTFLSIPFTALELSIIALFIRWILERDFTRIQKIYAQHKPLFFLTILLLIAAFLGVCVAPSLTSALGIFKAYFVEPILFFVVFIDLVKTKHDMRLVVIALATLAFFISLYSFAQILHLAPTPELWLQQGRFTSIFPYPNAAGLFLAPLIPLFFASAHTLSEKKSSILFIIIALCSLIAIFLAQTESAVVALIAGFIFWGFTKARRYKLASIFAIIIAVMATLYSPNIADKLLLRDWSGQVRRLMWNDTFTMLTQHPIFGVGLSGYPIAFIPYHQHPDIEIFQYPHNIIMNFWSEIGALGFFVFAGIIFYFFYCMFTHAENKSDIMFQSIGVAMLTLLIHGLVDVPYFKNDLSVLFWIILGMMIVYSSEKNEL